MKILSKINFNNTNGFALIEVVVTLAILFLAITASAAFFIRSYATVRVAGERSDKLFTARKALESQITISNENIGSAISLSINFDGEGENPGLSIQVPGRIIKVTENYSLVSLIQEVNGQEANNVKGEIVLRTFIYDSTDTTND